MNVRLYLTKYAFVHSIQNYWIFINGSSYKRREIENVRIYYNCQAVSYICKLHECKFDLLSVLILLFVIEGYEMEMSKRKVELLNRDFAAATP